MQVRTGLIRVPVSEIDWIEAARDYVLLHTPTRSHIHRATMAGLERGLDRAQIIRVHRSAFVRPDRVSEIKRHSNGSTSVILLDGTSVQVGPNYIDPLLVRLKLATP